MRPLVGALHFGAFILPLAQSGELGGYLLLHNGGLQHLVAGADQLDRQLWLHNLRADALSARRDLWRRFGGGGQSLGLQMEELTPSFAHHAAPERLVAPVLNKRDKKLKFNQTYNLRVFLK